MSATVASLHAGALHRLAKRHIPNLPLKEASTWIAILNHTISNPTEIKDTDSFMWVKANPNITIRTLQYLYYQRHPLEDLALQFRTAVPDELTTVKQLRSQRPDEKLVVLRALEAEQVNDDELKRGIELNSRKKLAGRDAENGISLDSHDEAADQALRLPNGYRSDSDDEEAENFDADAQGASPCDKKTTKKSRKSKPKQEVISLLESDDEQEQEPVRNGKRTPVRNPKLDSDDEQDEEPVRNGKRTPVRNPKLDSDDEQDEEPVRNGKRTPVPKAKLEPTPDITPSSKAGSVWKTRIKVGTVADTHLRAEADVTSTPTKVNEQVPEPRSGARSLCEGDRTPQAQNATKRYREASVEQADLGITKRHKSLSADRLQPAASADDRDDDDMMANTRQTPPVDTAVPLGLIEFNSLEDYEQGRLSHDVQSRIDRLPEGPRIQILSALAPYCETWGCHKQLRLKPWTCVGPHHGVLCTSCSRVWLGTYEMNTDRADALEEALRREATRKAELDAEGYAQDMDDDAPIRVRFDQWPAPQSSSDMFAGNTCGPARQISPSFGELAFETADRNDIFGDATERFADGVGNLFGAQQVPADVRYGPVNSFEETATSQSVENSNTEPPQPNRFARTFSSVVQAGRSAFTNWSGPLFPLASSAAAASQVQQSLGPNVYSESSRQQDMLEASPSSQSPTRERLDMSTSPELSPAPRSTKQESPILGSTPPPSTRSALPVSAALPKDQNEAYDSDASDDDMVMPNAEQYSSEKSAKEEDEEAGEKDEEVQESEKGSEEEEYFEEPLEDAGAKDDSEDMDYEAEAHEGDDEDSEFEP